MRPRASGSVSYASSDRGGYTDAPAQAALDVSKLRNHASARSPVISGMVNPPQRLW